MQADEFEGLSRSDLIDKAEVLGVDKASLLTRAELVDEIVRRTVVDPIERRIARGLLGVARDLVARVVERGLHLPDAAALIRGSSRPSWTPAKPPIATVTLAEIYATQGHRDRALSVLDEVLAGEPDHTAARVLREEIAASPEPPVSAAADMREGELPSSADAPQVGSAPSSETTAESPTPTPSAGPVGMLDDASLPERYDVDEVVVMPVDPKTVFVYWEIRASTLDRARERAVDGQLVVRVVAVTARWEGPAVETRDIEVADSVGDWFVRDLPPGAVIRAAIGWRAASGFDPLSVAMDLTAPPAGPAPWAATDLARYTEEEIAPSSDDGELAMAVERARRRVGAARAEEGGSSSWPAIPAAPWSMPETAPAP